MPAKSVNESEKFKTKYGKTDKAIRTKLIKLIRKVMENPKIGKPMKYSRKGTREVYLKPFRLSYAYDQKHERIILLDLYHKKRQ